jgi:hypothetical protein
MVRLHVLGERMCFDLIGLQVLGDKMCCNMVRL